MNVESLDTINKFQGEDIMKNRRVAGWTDVDDALPRTSKLVVVRYEEPGDSKGHLAVAQYVAEDHDWYFQSAESRVVTMTYRVTHWMVITLPKTRKTEA